MNKNQRRSLIEFVESEYTRRDVEDDSYYQSLFHRELVNSCNLPFQFNESQLQKDQNENIG